VTDSFADDLAVVARIDAVPTILEVVCRVTGMGFSAIARVTEDRWIACAVRDEINFGLAPGGELQIGTTICNEIRQSGQLVVIDHVAEDEVFRDHPTPCMYGFQSYISVPIRRPGGQFFGIHASNNGKIMIFAGGIPLKRDGKVVGAVGVSRGSREQDHAVAEAGAAAF